MTKPRKNARVVSLQADQRPVLFFASIVLLAALFLAGCAKVPYPPPELQAANAEPPARSASEPAASAVSGTLQKRNAKLAAALKAARQAQKPIEPPAAPTRAQVEAAAEHLQRQAAEARAMEIQKAANAKAAFERQQRLAAQANADREAEALAAARKRADEAAAKAESERQMRLAMQAEADRNAKTQVQAEKAAELARAKATFDRQQRLAAEAEATVPVSNATVTATRSAPRVDVATAQLAEPPALPVRSASQVDTPAEDASSAPLSEPELALQIASRGGTDGGANETNSEMTAEPTLMTSLARLSPSAGGADANLTGTSGADLSVAFTEGSGELSVDARNQLFELAQRLQEEQGIDVRLFGYADGLGEGPSRARRLSLSRLMTVRKFLIRQGVDMNSLDGRAMGEDPVAQNATDRVDIVIVRR